MKFSLSSVAVALAATSVAAQSVPDLVKEIPACAVDCIRKAGSSAGCDEGDFACNCKNIDKITPEATKCILSQGGDSCSSKDLAGVSSTVQKICEAVAKNGGEGGSSSGGPTPTGNSTVGPSSTLGTAVPSGSPSGMPGVGGGNSTGPGSLPEPTSGGEGTPSNMPPPTSGASAHLVTASIIGFSAVVAAALLS